MMRMRWKSAIRLMDSSRLIILRWSIVLCRGELPHSVRVSCPRPVGVRGISKKRWKKDKSTYLHKPCREFIYLSWVSKSKGKVQNNEKRRRKMAIKISVLLMVRCLGYVYDERGCGPIMSSAHARLSLMYIDTGPYTRPAACSAGVGSSRDF